MTAPADLSTPPDPVLSARPRGIAVRDALTMTWRNLLNLVRTPQVVVFATIQPLIFVLMFRYVFGGAIRPTSDFKYPYVDYLMPGVFAQTVVFGAMTTGVGLAEDLKKGLIGRFRSLPMAPSAVLVGRTLADLVRNVFTITLMVGVGFLIGFRVHTNAWAFFAGVGLMLLFAYSLSWVFALVGLYTRDAEAAQAASFPIIAPLVFASAAFVPVAFMAGWLQPFARNQPVSQVISGVRALLAGGPTSGPVLHSLAWITGITLVFATLSIRKYRAAVT
ncbi:MAG: ABC transporter permease [Acidimicrobiia bacterium]